MKKVVKTTEAPKKEVTKTVKKRREILGISLSKKLPNEMIATIEAIKTFKGKVNVPYNDLYNQYLVEMSKISKSKSNLRTRFDRILYRSYEAVVIRNSIQSAKFNLKANIKGITMKTKNPIIFKENQNAELDTVRNNFYTFKVLKSIETKSELKVSKELLSKIAELKS